MSGDRGRGGPLRVAIVDSGVHASHPHVAGVAGGIAFGPEGEAREDFVDRLGHGTAVAAVIREKAPHAALHVVKVFDRSLRTEIAALLAALDWAIASRFPLVNLSLGTPEPAHESALRRRVERARDAGVLIVSALRAEDGTPCLPGRLNGVLPVELDWNCPRDSVRCRERPGGRWVACASGYPRPIPGVSPERNLKGGSFAVANVTGCLAAQLAEDAPLDLEAARRLLAAGPASPNPATP